MFQRNTRRMAPLDRIMRWTEAMPAIPMIAIDSRLATEKTAINTRAGSPKVEWKLARVRAYPSALNL